VARGAFGARGARGGGRGPSFTGNDNGEQSRVIPFDPSVRSKDTYLSSSHCKIVDTAGDQSLTMNSAYEHGQNTAWRGKHIQACPFDAGTLQWREWRDGFMAYRP
jgi:hypothetical protein